MIRDCAVLSVEGTQAAGKSTFVHALTAHWRERGIHVACTGEPARESPLLEEIVVHNKGAFDLAAELDLFGIQLSTQIRAARHNKLLITDKTPANVLAYARMVLPPQDPATYDILTAMQAMCTAWMPRAVDLVVYCRDRFDQRSGGDQMRAKVLHLQDDADKEVYRAVKETGVRIVELPTGLTTRERVHWTTDAVESMGLLQL
ncbi:AAA family ATPase [Streptacidiphilus monticola]|uniref:AAA family ATPase n=1 Tax=Streptacidiphilus monticola TaxID=2161674 RepID=A0ABW1GC75_9ACTN